MKLHSSIVILAAALTFSSCSNKKWNAEGTIAGAEGKDLIVEIPNGNGGWYPIDTVAIASDGTFKVAGEAFGHPELLRMSLDGDAFYLPIDSLETVTVNAQYPNLGSSVKLSGAPAAEDLQRVNDMIAQAVAKNGETSVPYDQDLKRQLAEEILHNPAGIVAYYLVFHRVGDQLIFSPEDKSDLRIIGAVANAFTQHRPSDPRTAMLKDLYLSNRRLRSVNPSDTVVAQEIRFPEISLLDENGKERNLSDVAGDGKVVILNFTAYTIDGSQALNVELNKIYTAYRNRGLEIYQVGFDGDEFAWKQSAKNLPWITVYNSSKVGDKLLLDYNVGDIPAIFILNRQGDLVERVESLSRLDSSVARYL